MPWRGKWKTELGGVLMGHAIHPHDIFTYLMGPINSPLWPRRHPRQRHRGRRLHFGLASSMESGALARSPRRLGSVDEITRIRLAFENVTFESDHAPYNPGAALWKILPRNDEVKAADRCAAGQLASMCRRASRRRWRGSTMR